MDQVTAEDVVPSVVGVFHGLVERTPNPAPWVNGHLGARIELTVATNKSYTGKLISLGAPMTFSGVIEETDPGVGSSTAVISRGSLSALTLRFNFSHDRVIGSVSDASGNSVNISGWRKVWNTSTRPISANLIGRFNFHVVSDLAASVTGYGTGFGSFTVAAGGDVTVSGRLPDGSAFKTTTFVGPQGQVLIYQPLYVKYGSFIGVLVLVESIPGLGGRSVVQSIHPMSWHKPDQRPTLDRNRPEGFQTECSVSGHLYLPPVSGDVAGGLFDIPDNGALFFSGAALSSETPVDATFTLTSTGVVTLGGVNPAKAKFSLKPATGEYSGSFTLVDSDTNQQTGTAPDGNPIYRKITRHAKFQGLIVDTGTTVFAAGYYLMPSLPDPFQNPPVTLANSPLLGGEATFIKNSGAPEPVLFGFDVDAVNIVEGEVGWIRLVSQNILEKNQTFTIQVLLGSASKADLSATQFSVTIPAGKNNVVISLPVLDDGLDEAPEYFTLVLADGPGYDVNVGTCLVYIDDDEEPVELHSEPIPQLVPLGGDVGIVVEAVGSDLRYQWQRDLIDIPGAEENPLRLTNVQFSQAGSYRVKVFNALNEEITTAVDIAVWDTRPRILAHSAGSTATLTTGAIGVGLSYQWFVSGQKVQDDTGPSPRISGAKTPTLTIKNLSEADVDDYTCEVTRFPYSDIHSAGPIQLRLPTAKPELTENNLPDGSILKPYRHDIDYVSDMFKAPGVFIATGLPAGLSIDPETGIISGIPTRPVMNAPVTIIGINPVGSSAFQTTLTIHPFPSGSLGTFHGLVARLMFDSFQLDVPEWAKADLGARLELQTTTTGAFTGKLLNGSTCAFSGQLAYDENGQLYCSNVKVPVSGKNESPCYLWLTFDSVKQTFRGRLSKFPTELYVEPAVSALVYGWRNVWSKTAPAVSYPGRYNFTLDGPQENPLETPNGAGYGTFIVPTSGAFNISGLLSDGTPFVCNTFLGPEGQLLLYQPLFKVPGSFLGAIQINAITDPSQFSGIEELPVPVITHLNPIGGVDNQLNCSWNKPNQSDPSGKLYPRGFQPTYLGAEGGLYTPPQPGAIVMDLYDVTQNAVLNFSTTDTELTPQSLTLSSSGAATVPTGAEANPMKVSFSLNVVTGQFRGAFTRTDPDPNRAAIYDDFTGRLIRPQGFFTRSARFFGCIVHSASMGTKTGSGFFLLPRLPDSNASPAITTANAPMLSGKLTLSANGAAPAPLIVSFTEALQQFEESALSEHSSVRLTVRLSEPQPIRRSFNLALRNITTSASDLTLHHKTIVFEPGETEGNVLITTEDDFLEEQDEIFEVYLIDGPGYDVIPAKLRGYLVDDDDAVLFMTQPASRLIQRGTPTTLNVVTFGSGTLSYQWRRDGVPIPGAIQPVLELASPLSGKYDVVVTNPVGKAISDTANISTVDMNERYLPAILGGGEVTLPLGISAPAGAVSFQWINLSAQLLVVDGPRISGSTTPTLKINDITAADEAVYACIVTQPAKIMLIDDVPTVIEHETTLEGPSFHLLLVDQAPELMDIPPLTAPPLSGRVSQPFSYQISFSFDTSRWPASFSSTPLPAGLTLDPFSGLISGTPIAAVTDRSITITATNAVGSDSITTTLTIEPLDSSAIGTFHGFVARNLGRLVSSSPLEYEYPWEDAQLGGLIQLTTTDSGSYTGKLTYGTSTHNFTGSLATPFQSATNSLTMIPRSGKEPLFLRFVLNPAVGLQGELDASSHLNESPTPVKAWKNIWSTRQLATAYAGKYAFSIQSSMSGYSSSDSPGGSGFATCTVPANGTPFVIKGRLIDGTPFTSSSILGPRGEFLIYQRHYTNPGSVLSQLRLAVEPDTPADQPVFVETSQVSSLFKPAQSSTTEIYRDGVVPTRLLFNGGRAPVPGPGQIVMGLPNIAENASITFSGANIENTAMSPNNLFTIRPGGATVMKTGWENPTRTTVAVRPASSEFSGNFTLKDYNPFNEGTLITRTASFQGIFIQYPNGTKVGRGYFTLKGLPYFQTVITPAYTGTVEIYPY